MNSLMGNNQAMSTPNKKRSLRVFFLSTLLLLRIFVWTAPRRWEWRKHRLILFWVFCLNFWIYAVFSFFKPVDFDENMQPDLNICRITFYSTGGMLDTTQTRLNICRITFLKLRKLTKICALVWIYVVLPFTQTTMWLRSFPMSLNICRITFCSNSGEEREITGQFEYMSYYLLLN